MAYDPDRGRVVMFGGYEDGGVLADTWEWDGFDWVERHPPVSPPARWGAAMAWDAGRHTMLLFGGEGRRSIRRDPRGDTWEWDGTSWQERGDGPEPTTGKDVAMAYDPDGQRMVLLQKRVRAFAGVWERTDAGWERVETTGSRPGGYACGLAYDAAASGLLAICGDDDATARVLRGAQWSEVGEEDVPIPGCRALLASDPAGERVLLAAVVWGAPYAPVGIWVWQDGGWEQRAPVDPPPNRLRPVAAFDTGLGQTLVFGGRPSEDTFVATRADTWLGDGATWTEVPDPGGPSGRDGAAMAHDAQAGTTLLFGGNEGHMLYTNDTWVWDGAGWAEIPGPEAPSARLGQGLAYDAARGVFVLFGGLGERDTWTWSQAAGWTQLDPFPMPPATDEGHLAYDSRRRIVVHVGELEGVDDCGPYARSPCSATWEWDGEGWTRIAPEHVPAAPRAQTLAFDPARGRTVLVNDDPTGRAGDVLEWDGADWTRRQPVGGGLAVRSHATVYDAEHSRILVLGGDGDGAMPCPTDEEQSCMATWAYAPQHFVPHLVVAFDLAAGCFLDPCLSDQSTKTLASVGIRTRAGGLGHGWGTGNADGEPVPGYTVSVPSHGGWLELHRSGPASPDAPEDWSESWDAPWGCGEPWCEAATVREWVDRDGRLLVDVAPLAPQGASVTPGVAGLDYVELRVRYWRTGCEAPHAGNPEGTPDGTPCSDGDPETVGETCSGHVCVAH